MNVAGTRIDGLLLAVEVGGSRIDCEINCDFSYETDMLPATNPNVGRWRSFLAGVQGWTVAVNGILMLGSAGTGFANLFDIAMQGDHVGIKFGTITGVTPGMVLEGQALIRSINLGAPSVGKSQFSVIFQGSGPLNRNFEENELIIDAMPPEAEWPLIVEEDWEQWPV